MPENYDDISFDGVEITLGGKKRKINFTFLGIRMLAKKYGTFQNALQKLPQGEGEETLLDDEHFDVISSFILAGLIHEDKKLTQEDVESMISLRNMNYLFEKTMEAMNDSLPQQEERVGETKAQPE